MKKQISAFLAAFIVLVAAALVFLFSLKPQIAQTANTDWPQVQGSPGHKGYVPQTVVSPYTKLWQVSKPFPVSYRVQPIIGQNLIFLPSNDGSLYALATATGQQAWKYQTGGPLVHSAGFDSGKVFFGSTDNYIYALNATTGALVWKYQTGSTVKTAPVIAESKVFIGGSDGFMYALDENNGSLAWKYNANAPIYDTAAYDNGRIFFGAMNAKGYGLVAATGAEAWTPVQLGGQGFRDSWTVAGNGKVFFTPVLVGTSWNALSDGTVLFSTNNNPVIYNQPWDTTQQNAVLSYLAANPTKQPLYVIDQATGAKSFTPPVLYISGGSQSSHAPPVLLPNGNANVMYRRSDGSRAARYGATTNDAIYIGELNLTTGKITPVDSCTPGGGGWNDCGNFKNASISDESTSLVRSGDIIYVDSARGTGGLDTKNSVKVTPALARYNTDGGYADAIVFYNDYIGQGQCNTGGGWRLDFCNLISEMNSDGNNIKRPTPLVNDTFYILHYDTITAVKGTLR